MHVVCNIPNASTNIDGHVFVPVEWNGKRFDRVSEDLPDEIGNRLLGIRGFELFRGDSESVAKAIEDWRTNNLDEVVGGDVKKDREIAELQASCSALSSALHEANRKLMEKDEEIVRLRSLIGEPSAKWTRDQLAAFAESVGLVVNEESSKAEILDSIESRLAQGQGG